MIIGLDMFTAISATQYKCLRRANISFHIPSAASWHSGVNPIINTMLAGATAAGIATHVSMQFCRSIPAVDQLKRNLDHIAGGKFEHLFIEMGANDNIFDSTKSWDANATCSWTRHTQEDNVHYLSALVGGIKESGHAAGMWIDAGRWSHIFGNHTGVPSDIALWHPQYDNVSNCADFTPFGPFSKMYVKMYMPHSDEATGINSCGITKCTTGETPMEQACDTDVLCDA